MIANKLLTVMTLMMTFSGASMADATHHCHVIGRWQTNSNNVQQKEIMEFTADNRVILIRNNKEVVSGRYSLNGDTIENTFYYRGQQVPISMLFLNDKGIIDAHYKNIGKVVSYARVVE